MSTGAYYNSRRAATGARRLAKADRRAQRAVKKAERIARGERGAPVDWSASTSERRIAP
jgi:hypothetical protein